MKLSIDLPSYVIERIKQLIGRHGNTIDDKARDIILDAPLNYGDINGELLSLLGDERLNRALNCPSKDQLHPIQYLFSHDPRASQVLCNTSTAIRRSQLSFSETDNPDFHRLMSQWARRAGDVQDYSTSASALAEIRSLGILLNTQGRITQLPQGRGCDWVIDYADYQFSVEVKAKQRNAQSAKKLEEFRNGDFSGHESVVNGFRVKEMSHAPMGEKAGQSSISQAVHVVRGIKSKKTHQLDQCFPSILWIDFQDQAWWGTEQQLYSYPLLTWNGMFSSSVLWNAIYGRKGDPIFECATLTEYGIYQLKPSCLPMQQDGIFRDRPYVDFVIASLPRNTVVYQNPESPNAEQMNRVIWSFFMALKWIDLDHSWIDWDVQRLRSRIQISRDQIADA
ncbi:MAG: hypothetical protein AAF685_03735 [Cyanobacteria bacterium P01_C01_bin.89]